MSDVDLGFIEKVEPWKIKSKYFPSKVGGYPAWLALKHLPSLEQLSCKKCNKPLAFLCQLYSPFTKHDYAFHRTVFVFICRSADCSQENDASNVKIFRSQLPRINDFYDSKPYKEEEGSDTPSAADYGHLCAICGALGPKFCGECRVVHYCSRDHQAIHWKSGHKLNCKNNESSCTSKKNTFIFPEFMLELEPEDLDDPIPEKSEEEIMKEYRELLSSGRVVDRDNVEDETDLAEIAAKETDKQFQKFRTRIKIDPNQVVRYERGGVPLYVSSINKPEAVPKCEFCGKDRQFEFQIMPQLLVHLKVDNLGKSIDWGTILAYCCPDSCSNETAYTEEVAFKQDYDPVEIIRQK